MTNRGGDAFTEERPVTGDSSGGPPTMPKVAFSMCMDINDKSETNGRR